MDLPDSVDSVDFSPTVRGKLKGILRNFKDTLGDIPSFRALF